MNHLFGIILVIASGICISLPAKVNPKMLDDPVAIKREEELYGGPTIENEDS